MTKDGEYQIWMPKVAGRRINWTNYDLKECQGCGEDFKRNKSCWEWNYYDNVINHCRGYKKLNLIRKCESCKLIFT